MSRIRVRTTKPVRVSSPPYQAVIDVVMSGNYNAAAMIALLAREHPGLFMELHNKTTAVGAPQWMRDVIVMKVSGEHIPAIKLMREHTGLGLKQAKDICDCLGDRLLKRKTSHANLDAAQTDLLNKLLSVAHSGIPSTP